MMFKKLLNVGKGHSVDKQHQHASLPFHHHLNQQQYQQQQQQLIKNQFQLNEIKSYGFSHLCCLAYSSQLSLLAFGSKSGLIRVLGNASVEFSYQLEAGLAIRQLEFIDSRPLETTKNFKVDGEQTTAAKAGIDNNELSPKIVALTDNGELHLLELKTFKRPNLVDNATQTDSQPTETNQSSVVTEYTKLGFVGLVDHFKSQIEDEDRSKRVTTLEISADGQTIFVGSEGGNLYLVPIDAFLHKDIQDQQQQVQPSTLNDEGKSAKTAASTFEAETDNKQDEMTDVSLSVEQQVSNINALNGSDVVDCDISNQDEPFKMIKFDEIVANQLGNDIKLKKPGAIESIKRHPASGDKILLSYHRGLSVIYDIKSNNVDKYFYHNQVLESSCFADQYGESFYTSHNDGSYIKWDCRQDSQTKANEDFLSQLYGPYPCKPTPKIQACTGLINDQLEELIVFSGGMPRATYDDKNPVTIVRAEADGKDTIKTVLDFTSKVLDFVVITKPRGSLGSGAKLSGSSTGLSSGGGKKNRQKQQQLQQQRNTPIAVALAILAEEEFVVIDLLNSDAYLEFPLPYLNCVHSSAITCNQHYSSITDQLYEQLLAYNRQQFKGKFSSNDWPIVGGKVIEAPESKSHDILLTGHEDGSVDIWDVSNLSMRHLIHLSTAQFFLTNDDDLIPINDLDANNKQDEAAQDSEANKDNSNLNLGNDSSQQIATNGAWPPLKRVGRFDPFSDDARLAIRRLTLCPRSGTLVVAGTGGQVLVFELNDEPNELSSLTPNEITIVSDPRFVWKGHEKLTARPRKHKQSPGYQLVSCAQLNPPVAATALDLSSSWHLYALGTSYGFILYDYANHHAVVNKCTLNVADFNIISGDAPGTMSRKKSFRKSLRESFRRLRRGRSQRFQTTESHPVQSGPKTAFSRPTTGVRTLNQPTASSPLPPDLTRRNVFSVERQVEPKVELSSIVRCVSLTWAVITNSQPSTFRPTLWVGTNSGQVLVYAITLSSEQQTQQDNEQQASNGSGNATDSNQTSQSSPTAVGQRPLTTARLAKEIQLKHRAPIIAIFTSPEAPQSLLHSSASDEQSSASFEKSASFESSGTSSAVDRKSPDLNESNDSSNQQSIEQALSGKPSQGVTGYAATHNHKLVEQQARVLICSEEQFKVFNLPNLKPFCKFKLTANEGLRAKKISITQFKKLAPLKSLIPLKSSKSVQSFATQTSRPTTPAPSSTIDGETDSAAAGSTKPGESNNNSLTTLNNNHASNAKELMNAKFGAKTTPTNSPSTRTVGEKGDANEGGTLFEPYMVCMSNQGDCAIYSVPDLKRQAQIQVCKREDINGITSTMLTNYGEGYYLKSSSNFLRFSISTQRVPRVLSVV